MHKLFLEGVRIETDGQSSERGQLSNAGMLHNLKLLAVTDTGDRFPNISSASVGPSMSVRK